MFARWPDALDDNFKTHLRAGRDRRAVRRSQAEVVSAGRALRRDFNLASNLRVRFVLKPAVPIAPHEAEVMRILLNAEALELNDAYAPPKGTLRPHAARGIVPALEA